MSVVDWILVGAIAIVAIATVIIILTKLFKMSPEERMEKILTYLKGIVAWAEKEILGNKKGKEKLEAVKEYFNSKAPWIMKMSLSILGKDKLDELIEKALSEVKTNFGSK